MWLTGKRSKSYHQITEDKSRPLGSHVFNCVQGALVAKMAGTSIIVIYQ